MKKHSTRETYIIRYDEKVGEYWQNNKQEEVDVVCDANFKNNHKKAEDLFLSKIENKVVKIHSVTYC